MTPNDFQAKLKATTKDSEDIYTSPDFQCDQTGGFTTSLPMLGKRKGVAAAQ